MKFYSYIIDNNEDYEDHSDIEIFSTEKISLEEFSEIVHKAFEACGDFANYARVANKIVEMDRRFFFPERVHMVVIGHERNNYNNKIRGFCSCK